MSGQQPEVRITKLLVELLPEEDREHGITLIREPGSEELERIERADGLIQGASAARAYERCRDLLDLIQTRLAELQAEESAAPGQIESLRAAFASLLVAFERLASDLSELVHKYGTEQAARAFDEQAAATQASQLWREVEALTNPASGRFKRDQHGSVVWQRQADDETIFVPAVANLAGLQAQHLLVHQFLLLEDELLEASTLLRELAVEAPEGAPGLAELTITGDTPDLSHIAPRALAIDRIPVVLRASRIARKVQEDATQAGAETDEPESHAQTEEAGDVDDTPPEERPADEAAPVAGRAGEPSGAEPTQENAGDPVPLPVELGSLFQLARTLDSDLEKAWSSALNEVQLQPGLKKQLAATFSLLYALQRKVAAEDEALKAVGSPPLKEWPLSIEGVAELEVGPELEMHARQLRMAQLDALTGVADVVQGLREPANVSISINEDNSEEVERFWAAGAFGLLRDRLALLERITREHDRIQQQLNSETPDPTADAAVDSRFAAFDRLQLGTQAWTGGDPEAALIHGVAAIASALGASTSELPAKVAEAADDQPGLNELSGETFTKAIQLAEATLQGRPNVAVAVFLAPVALRIAHLLILGPMPSEGLTGTELGDLIESEQPLQPLEPEDDDPPA